MLKLFAFIIITALCACMPRLDYPRQGAQERRPTYNQPYQQPQPPFTAVPAVPTQPQTGTVPPPQSGQPASLQPGSVQNPVPNPTVTPPPTTVLPNPGVSTQNFTRGTGGRKGAGSGRSVSGLNFLYDVPQSNSAQGEAHGLLVLLHGSSASSYREFVQRMARVASQHGLIRISVLAPNGRGWNEGGEESAARALHELIQQDFFPKYNIDRTKIFFSGQSSGAGFLSSHFVPLYAGQYQGGAFMQCGAEPPRVRFTPNDLAKNRFHLHFEITTGDSLWRSSYQQAVRTYTDLGMKVTSSNQKRGGHCQFDQQQVIIDNIQNMLP